VFALFFDSEIWGNMYLRNDSTIAHINTMNKIQEQKKPQKGSVIGSRPEGHAPCFGGDTLINYLLRRCVQSAPQSSEGGLRDEIGQVPMSYSLFLRCLNDSIT
jgi:hypothetical protein